jgi:hypothetical protein
MLSDVFCLSVDRTDDPEGDINTVYRDNTSHVSFTHIFSFTN